MVREISAGGVVVHQVSGNWQIAAIEPRREPSPATTSGKKKSQKVLLALPKGLVDPGEKPEETAIREVREETGLTALPITKLTDIKYVYARTWGDRAKVFKIVSFYLLRYQSGTIDDLTQDMRIEVKRALWLGLDEAESKLAYSNERSVIELARNYLKLHPEMD